MKKTIHINRHKIAKNKGKAKPNLEPVITVKTYKNNVYCTEVSGDGPFKVVYRPEKPLKCGAVCWIETEGEITID